MFCDVCEKEVQVVSKAMDREIKIKGDTVSVSYMGNICGVCLNEIYDDEIEMDLIEKAKTLYKQRNKLLPSADIASYMRRKKISAEEMAHRVQCSVNEIIMASHGGIQSKELDTKIRAVVKKSA